MSISMPDTQVISDGGYDLPDILDRGYLFEIVTDSDGTADSVFALFHNVRYDTGQQPRVAGTTITGNSFTTPASAIDRLRPIEYTDLTSSEQAAFVEQLPSAVNADPQRMPASDMTRVIEQATADHFNTMNVLLGTGTYLRHHPQALTNVGQPLMDLLTATGHPIGRPILSVIQGISEERPTAIAPFVTDFASLCEEYGATATGPLKHLAEHDPTAVLDAVPGLAAAGEDGAESLRTQLLYIFAQVSKEHPEALLPAVDLLIDSIHSEDTTDQTNALSTLGRIASHYPDVGLRVVDPVVALLNQEEDQVRRNAMGLLADVAQEHPDSVIAHADTIAAGLTDTDERVRVHTGITLNRSGRADPSAIADQADQLRAALDDPHPEVRANACTLIGNASVPVSTDKLRDLRQHDPDNRVREQAAYALSQISGR